MARVLGALLSKHNLLNANASLDILNLPIRGPYSEVAPKAAGFDNSSNEELHEVEVITAAARPDTVQARHAIGLAPNEEVTSRSLGRKMSETGPGTPS